MLNFSFVTWCLATAGFLETFNPQPIPAGYLGKHEKFGDDRIRVLQIAPEGSVKRDILAIHGTPGSIEDFVIMAKSLAARGYRTTMYDRPGQGFSHVRGKSFELVQNAQWASKIIDRMGLRNPIVIGHSYGGSIALRMAVNNVPNIGGYLVIGAPAYVTPTPFEYHISGAPLVGPLAPLAAAPMIRKDIPKFFAPDAKIPEGFIDERIKIWTANRVLYNNAWERKRYQRSLDAISGTYKHIPAPFDIVIGEKDLDYIHADAFRLGGEIPNNRLTEVPHVGHYVQFEAPQATIDLITSFDQRLSIAGNRQQLQKAVGF